eukprot:jgi/Undpi1/13612/HiC_scaffold_9.g03266.m1
MSGPPSWIDTGGDDEGSAGDGGYGGGAPSSSGSEWASGGPPSFQLTYSHTDRVIAICRLSLVSTFIVLGIYALVKFYRSRWVLDIRTRSARLVIIEGGCVLLAMLVGINGSVDVIWGVGLRWFWSSLLLFFVSPTLFGSYICRALRLAVVFHPRAKRALPWLIPERNYIVVLLLMSLAMLSIPIYHEYKLPIWEIIPKQNDILITMSIVFAGLLAALYPFIRKVDDLFNISTELVVVTIALVCLAATQKVVSEYEELSQHRWLGGNLMLIFSAAVFGFSVVDPLRRLAFDPLAASKRNYADRVLLSRREGTVRTHSSGRSSGAEADSEDEGRTARIEEGRGGRAPCIRHDSGEADDDDGGDCGGDGMPWTGAVTSLAGAGGGGGGGGGGAAGGGGGGGGRRWRGGGGAAREEPWDFERLARTPLLAAAFEDYCRKALCHESVLFLSEVSRYQNNDFSTPTDAAVAPGQFNAFCHITDTFIKAGAREEVNISDSDKKRIVSWTLKGRACFELEEEEERRLVFGRAYAEVKNMLEANLLNRFLRTDQFESVRAQRENITMMMVSPQQEA